MAILFCISKARISFYSIARFTLLTLAFLLSLDFIFEDARAAQLGPQRPEMSRAEMGEWLVGELNCAACHATEDTVAARLSFKQSPHLDRGGVRWTPQYLRAYLAEPHRVKPGTTMPDLLHGMEAGARTEVVEALTHFLMSSYQGAEPAGVAANAYKMTEGRSLYHSVGCVACHAPQEPLSTLRAATGEKDTIIPDSVLENSVPLGPLATKYTVAGLSAFLLDPLAARPSGRMPSSNLSPSEASSIAMYLLRAQTNSPSALLSKRVQGVAYDYYEGGIGKTADLDSMTPVQSGMVESFSTAPKRRDQNFGFRYTGFIRIPRDGEYRFFVTSDDGARLFIDDRQVLENDGTHPASERSGRMDLAAGDHPIMVVYFNAGGPFEFKVSWKGPGFGKEGIPASALSYQGQPMIPVGQKEWLADAAQAQRGSQLFSSLGCVSCHTANGKNVSMARSGPSLLDLKNKLNAGCLSPTPGAQAAKFDLTEIQRQSIREALASSATWTLPLSEERRVAQTMAALNCYACHARHAQGGPGSDRQAYFTTVGDEDLGDEGRLPPHLSGVGNKLKPDWMREVLLKEGSVRPYMATRMPQFGEANVGHLVPDFAKVDAQPPVHVKGSAPMDNIKYGRALVGAGGLSCISCHSFGNYKSLGIPAMDLTQMAKRLQPDWFHRYLLDPPSLRPGTRMPAFWPEGKSLREDLLQGDTHKQINAIWAYLAKATEAGIPPGLIQGKMELIAEAETRIYRAFINDSGIRGIGVAFPEKANYTFDGVELRPALIWQGPFMDAAKHRVGRGAGFEGPLGYNVLKMPPAPTFALLEKETAAWPRLFGKQAGFKMKGYRLDDKRRPTFLYSYQDIAIEDHTDALPGELEASLVRTLKFKADRSVPNLWHRAWVAGSIEEQSGDTYLIDGKIQLKLRDTGGAKPVLRKSNDQTELLIPVEFKNNEAQLIEEIIW